MPIVNLTIPTTEGETVSTNVTGLNCVILESPLAKDRAKTPKLFFDSLQNEEFPAFEESVLGKSDCTKFERVIVKNDGEAGGQNVQLLITGLELERKVEVPPSIAPDLKATFSKGASDSVQSFSSAELTNSNGLLPVRANIFVVDGATAGINYAFGKDPVQGLGNADSMYLDNEPQRSTAEMFPLQITGTVFIQEFRFISAVATETPNLIVTFEY